MPLDELDRIEISCVSDLVSFVRENAKRVYHSNVNAMTWYRGQENYEWHLSPAVYRDNQFQYESLYIKELERIRPAEFVNCSNFDKLVKMQHYGLPTRLLDVTSNPLVALFFACNSHREIDGALYCFLNSPTFWEDNWAVQIVTDYVMNPTNSINELIRRGKDRLPASLKNESAWEAVFWFPSSFRLVCNSISKGFP